MKACLAQGYPFAFGLTIYTSFYEAETNDGHVPTPKPDESIADSYGNSLRSDETTRYVPHGTDVSNTNILADDFPDDTDTKIFWNIIKAVTHFHAFSKSVETHFATWTSDSYHKTVHSRVNQSSKAIITGNSRVLWIDWESDENNSLMKKISIEACTAVEFCENFSSLEPYLQQHGQDGSSSSSAFQIICSGYYKNVDKNPLDVLLLLDQGELGHVPVTVFTHDKEGLINHLRNKASSKGISDWKDRLYIVRHGTDLINRIVSNNKKTSSNHNRH
ncbi:unnamed protein product [Rotaria magnacalcarata]|nr:unnamed protein product [Rotaria magnacalcarata]